MSRKKQGGRVELTDTTDRYVLLLSLPPRRGFTQVALVLHFGEGKMLLGFFRKIQLTTRITEFLVVDKSSVILVKRSKIR